MKGRNMLMGIVLLTSILFTTIVYSAFNTQLNIEGEAIVRSEQDIRITNISIKEQTNGAYETYNNKYNRDVTFMYVTLPSNSSITYEVDITNQSNSWYLIESIIQQSHSNSNVNVDVSLNVNDKINNNSKKTFTITLTNNTSTEQQEALVYKYNFYENGIIVTFDANGGNVLTTSKIVSHDGLYGTLPTPTREGYTFKGWNGKNLLDNIWRQGDWDGVDVLTDYRVSSTSRIFVEKEQNIVFSYKPIPNENYKFWAVFSDTPNEPSMYYWTGMKSDTSFSVHVDWDTYVTLTWCKGDCENITTSEIEKLNVLVEYGETPTQYEPYYITNSTTVVQEQNHTLKAIWEEN